MLLITHFVLGNNSQFDNEDDGNVKCGQSELREHNYHWKCELREIIQSNYSKVINEEIIYQFNYSVDKLNN